jgi:hypothetical protein
MKTTFKLTPENAARIAQYYQLIGWTETELINRLLNETLSCCDDRESGSLEGFSGAIYYRDRTQAERVVQIVQKQFDGQLPDSLKTEIHEHSDGRFDLHAQYIDQHGDLERIC